MPTWLQIGLVGKAHGLRGHFFVAQRDDILPVELGSKIYIDHPDRLQSFELEESRMQGQRPLAKLRGINAREQVDELVGQGLWVDRELVEEDEDEYFWSDLIGKEVIDSEGQRLGVITDIQNFGASDILTVQGSDARCLDLALVDVYFDMSFEAKDAALRLVVPAATFVELWRD